MGKKIIIAGKRKTREEKNYEIAKKVLESGYYDSAEEKGEQCPKQSHE